METKRKGFTLVELLVVIAIIALLMGILMPALSRVRQIAFRMVCGSNLSGIGRAMLIYANDYDHDFPRAGYVGTVWSTEVPSWAATDRASAFNYYPLAGSYGEATISSSFYLLVRYAEVTPKSFTCKGEPSTTVFKVENYSSAGTEDEDVWDFGPTDDQANIFPTRHCSYSYHLPYNKFFLSTASSEPGMAVAADRNPFLDPDVVTGPFLWDSHARDDEGIADYQYGNAGAHQREGQNVLFMDNHVSFEKQSFCGIKEDNIYTHYHPSSPIQEGMPPNCDLVFGDFCGEYPNHAKDSLLVNECGAEDVLVPPEGPPILE